MNKIRQVLTTVWMQFWVMVVAAETTRKKTLAEDFIDWFDDNIADEFFGIIALVALYKLISAIWDGYSNENYATVKDKIIFYASITVALIGGLSLRWKIFDKLFALGS